MWRLRRIRERSGCDLRAGSIIELSRDFWRDSLGFTIMSTSWTAIQSPSLTIDDDDDDDDDDDNI